MTAPETPNELPIIDEALFEQVRGRLRDKFSPLLAYYFAMTETYIAHMERALGHNDAVGLLPPAHTVKSSSRQLGMLRLGELAAGMEETARSALSEEKRLPELEASLALLKAAFGEIRRELERQALR